MQRKRKLILSLESKNQPSVCHFVDRYKILIYIYVRILYVSAVVLAKKKKKEKNWVISNFEFLEIAFQS